MQKHKQVTELVKKTYKNSKEEFAHWMLKNHLSFVAKKAEELSVQFGANADLAVAGAWLHDFGDAFVSRHDKEHEESSRKQAKEVLLLCDYSPDEIQTVLYEVIEPHSCRDGHFPQTLEGQVLATADALAHLTTDFYLQFAWKHLPEGKSYPEFLIWAQEKMDRDFNNKIFFDEVKKDVSERYHSLKTTFALTEK